VKAEREQGSKSIAPSKEVTSFAKDRLVSMSRAVYGWGRDWINHLIDEISRRKPVSISYRYLARELSDRFADHESTPRIVFSCAASLEASSEVLILIAHFLQDEIGGKVLLVDQTFRSGGVSDRFGYTGEAGLTECLFESGHSVTNYIKTTADPGVFVLPAGRASGKGKRLLKTQSVASLLDELNQFDYVLMQQGSITMDTRYLDFARLADLVLLCVEEGKTLVSEFEACQKIFHDYNVQELGLVMMETDD